MILIVDMNYKGSLGFYEFVLPICRVVEPELYEVHHYSEVKDGSYQKIILSGTPLKDNGFRENLQLFEWLISCNKPVLGICAGMQVIGLVFNSQLDQCQEIGMTQIETVKENYLFSSTFAAYELHNYRTIPSDTFEILARSEKCIQGIKHKEKEIYGLLFHPEVRNKDIIRRFIRK